MEEEISRLDKSQASNRLAKIMGESTLPNNDDLKLKSPSVKMDSATPQASPSSKTLGDKMQVDGESKSEDANNKTSSDPGDVPIIENKANNTDEKEENKQSSNNESDNKNNENKENNTNNVNSNDNSEKNKNSNDDKNKNNTKDINEDNKISESATDNSLKKESDSAPVNNLIINTKLSNNTSLDDILSRPIIQKVSKTKEGKKRIQPMHISSIPSVTSSSSLPSSALPQSQFTSDRYDFHQSEPRIYHTSSSVPSSGFPILKRKHPGGDGAAINVKKIFSKSEDGEEEKQQFILPTILPLPSIPTILAIPKIPKLIYYKIPHDENLLSSKVIECDNSKSKFFFSSFYNIIIYFIPIYMYN